MKTCKIVGLCLSVLLPAVTLIWAQEDRVGFPRNYAKKFKLYHVFNREGRPQLREMWINSAGGKVANGKPFPYGTVIVMATYMAKGMDGEVMTDEKGLYVKDELRRIDVMRKEKGFGEKYGKDRAGEWEFNAYSPEGELRSGKTSRCAKCHNQKARDADFVFTTKELFKN